MTKFYGVLGYGETKEVDPGIWEDVIVERQYSGDLVKNYRRQENSGSVNDNINLSNEVSVVVDAYAMENYFNLRYLKFMMPNIGGYWKVSSADVEYPRMRLTVGGVYNGPKA